MYIREFIYDLVGLPSRRRGGACCPRHRRRRRGVGGCCFGQFGTDNSGKSALDSGSFRNLFARIYGKNVPKLLQNTAFFPGAPRPYLTF